MRERRVSSKRKLEFEESGGVKEETEEPQPMAARGLDTVVGERQIGVVWMDPFGKPRRDPWVTVVDMEPTQHVEEAAEEPPAVHLKAKRGHLERGRNT